MSSATPARAAPGAPKQTGNTSTVTVLRKDPAVKPETLTER
jgi:hypothetical protein